MRFKFFVYIFSFFVLSLIVACADEGKPALKGVFDHDESLQVNYDLNDIQNAGEIIVLTLYGPDTYFEFRGEVFGNQYKIAQSYAKAIGVSARVNVCRTQAEMLDKLSKGEGDIIAFDLPVDSLNEEVIYCGKKQIAHFLDTLALIEHDKSIKTNGNVAWAVRKSSPLLAQKLNEWIAANDNRFLAISQPKLKQSNDSRKHTSYVSDEYFPDIPVFQDYPGNSHGQSYGNASNRHYSDYYSSQRQSDGGYSRKGTISYYDDLFIKYAPSSGMDWKLLAAIAYNESAFNPNATSHMGAMGLMQLMPSTARQYGAVNPYDPEQSVRASAKLIANLIAHYASVPDPSERINFMVAAYNAGPGHVDDARRLAEKRGKDKNVWKDNVDEFVLYMSNPEYYNDPVVRHGYFRGGETYNYVNYVRSDWDRFRK